MRKSSVRCPATLLAATLLAATLGSSTMAQSPGNAVPPPQPVGVIGAPAGTGPLPAVAESDASMRENTLYHPARWPRQALPLVLWAEGGCADNGLMYGAFLREIASHGYFIVAAGYPRAERPAMAPPTPPASTAAPDAIATRPTPPAALEADATSSEQLVQAIGWAQSRNADPKSPLYRHIDMERIAVMGHSCGGVQAINIAADPRIRTAVVFNSGVLNQRRGGRSASMETLKDQLTKLHTPVAYINGGPTDVAYENATDDFARIGQVAVFFAENGVGHGGTYWTAPNGGDYAQVATAWLDWQLKGDAQAAKMFRGADCGLCTRAGWKVQKKRID